MSDSEGADTDALLLIPPDLFLHDSSDTESLIIPTKNHHIKHLAQTAESLQNRLKHLENTSLTDSQIAAGDTTSLNNTATFKCLSTPKKYSLQIKNCASKSLTLPRNKRRTPHRYTPKSADKRTVSRQLNFSKTNKKSSTVDIDYLSDTDSTFSEGVYNMESFISNISDSPQKNLEGSILNEIDTFLNNIGKFQLTDLVDNIPETNIPSKDVYNVSNDIKLDRILSKYINLESGQVLSSTNKETHNYTCSKNENNFKDSITSLPNSSIRNENLNKLTMDNENNSNRESVSNCIETNDNNGSEMPITKTNIRIFNKDYILKPTITEELPKMELYNRHQKQQCNVNEPLTLPNQNSSTLPEVTLPSLRTLWSNTSESKIMENSIDTQKYEEEKLRRQHCEIIIEQLQKRLLEQQQKIAVAVKIDNAKDDAISKLKQTLSNLSVEFNSIQRNNQEKYTKLETQCKSSLLNNEILKKKLDENEEALKYMHANIGENEDNMKMLTETFDIERKKILKEIDDLKNVIKEKDVHIKEIKDSSDITIRLNKQLSENMTILQDNLEKTKVDSAHMKQKFDELHSSYVYLEDELSIVRKDKVDLLSRIAEEKSRNSHLDGQKKNLQFSLDSACDKIRTLEYDFSNFKTNSELKNTELKAYYQKQMDSIVKEKVEEFQKQLDAAKCLMLEEIQAKEKDIALQFARHLQKVEDRHQTDMNILKNKHRDELKSLQFQATKYKQTIQLLEDKLTCFMNKRGEIANQIHNIMENQWQQTLKIITNGGNISNTSEPKPSHKEPNECIIMETKNGKTSSYQESFSKNKKKDVQITDEQLQYYVKLLLQKSPGIPDLSEASETLGQSHKGCANKSKNSKNSSDFEYPTNDRSPESAQMERKSEKHSYNKPPWK